jgi:hypothetical protein
MKWAHVGVVMSVLMAGHAAIAAEAAVADAEPERFVDGVARILDPKLAQVEPSAPIPDPDSSAVYADRTLRARMALAPGDRISEFTIQPE